MSALKYDGSHPRSLFFTQVKMHDYISIRWRQWTKDYILSQVSGHWSTKFLQFLEVTQFFQHMLVDRRSVILHLVKARVILECSLRAFSRNILARRSIISFWVLLMNLWVTSVVILVNMRPWTLNSSLQYFLVVTLSSSEASLPSTGASCSNTSTRSSDLMIS
jgi:hypothetical protein